MSTTTIVFIALLLITIVGWTYSLTANYFGQRRHHPPGYPHGYGYPPPHYSPPRQRENESASFSIWPFMILITLAAIFYLSGYVTSTETVTDRTEARPVATDDEKPEAKEKKVERSRFPEGDGNYVISDIRRNRNRQRQAETPPDSYYSDEYRLVKGPVAEEVVEKAPDYTTGYGIQLFASEKDWLSAKDKERLRRRFDGRPLLSSPKWKDGSLLYRTIAGGFDTKAEALDARRVHAKYFDEEIQVVRLSDLKELSLYE